MKANAGLKKNKTVAIATLGCKVNQYESSCLAEMFRGGGYDVVDFKDKADVYVINTCSVTNTGDRKSRQAIRRAVKANPDGLVVVTGCFAQVSPQEVLSMPGVDLVLGTTGRSQIVGLVEQLKKGAGRNAVRDVFKDVRFEEMPAIAATDRVRAYVKIQEGCSNFCSYCIVPYTRGPMRSRDPGNILEEAALLAEAGYREIVLTGIHTGAYGKERGGTINLAGLMARLKDIKGLARIRLSSIEPMDISGELIELMAEGDPFCPHLHIPLQSGDDQILKAMKRHYRADDFKKIIAAIRKQVADAAVTSDVMVGFPGENDSQFMNTYNLVKELKLSRLHIFKYSPRKGTAAALLGGQVSPAVKEDRSNKMIALGEKLSAEFAAGYLGKTVQVLVEESTGEGSGLMQGYTPNYLRVAFPGSEEMRGKIVSVRTEKISGPLLTGRIINNDAGFVKGCVE